ncbi:hypothetical protein LAZ67_X002921, partial [Cordylochernes scorpioides]
MECYLEDNIPLTLKRIIVQTFAATDEFIEWCRKIEVSHKQRVNKHLVFDRLPNVAVIDSADSESMVDEIRRIVHEEVHRALNPESTTPEPSLVDSEEQLQTELHTDASGYGIGAVLVQTNDGKERPVGYASRTLSKAEKNYSTTERECLAAIWAITKFRPYLFGREFVIVTDHHALCWLSNLKDPTGRLARWALKLQEYNVMVVYKSGRKHQDVDCLSRNPLQLESEEAYNDEDDDIPSITALTCFKAEQRKHPKIGKLIEKTEGFGAESKGYEILKGTLYKNNFDSLGNQYLLVIPKHLRLELLKSLHDALPQQVILDFRRPMRALKPNISGQDFSGTYGNMQDEETDLADEDKELSDSTIESLIRTMADQQRLMTDFLLKNKNELRVGRPVKMDVATFVGRNADPKIWIKVYENICGNNGWVGDEARINRMRSYLTGSALLWFYNKFQDEEEYCWKDWKQEFICSFNENPIVSYDRAFTWRYRGGSLVEYFYQKQRKMQRGMPGLSEELLIIGIIHGLPQYMQEQLAMANIKCKQNLLKLLENIRPISEKNYSESRPSARTLGTVKKPVHFTESSDTGSNQFFSETGPDLVTRRDVEAKYPSLCKRTLTIISKFEVDFGLQENFRIISSKPYQLENTKRNWLNMKIRSMLSEGIIKPSNSAFASPCIVIPKYNRDYRLCIDYRKINDETLLDPFPFPRIDDIINVFGGCRFFSRLDLKDGFWQLGISENTRKYTAFVTPSGHYEFLKLPFGWKNSPAKFQRIMTTILEDLLNEKVEAYIDDICCGGYTQEDCSILTHKILERLNTAGLVLHLDKCQFCVPRIYLLGRGIDGDTNKIRSEVTEKVRNMKRPYNLRSLQCFTGLTNHFRAFIKDYAHIVRPLDKLNKTTDGYENSHPTRSGLFYEMANADQKPLEAPTVEAGVTTGGDAGFDPIPFNPSLNIRKYAGDEDPRQWITSLEEVGFLYRWADYIITRYAAMNLVGPAKTWYEFHKVNLATWEIFKTRLIQDFASLEKKDEMMLKLNRMQGWNELAMRFAEDILLQCSKVQPNMEDMEKIQFVIGGLKKEYALALYLNPPKTIEELLEACKRIDGFEKEYLERKEKNKILMNRISQKETNHAGWNRQPREFQSYKTENYSRPMIGAPRQNQTYFPPQETRTLPRSTQRDTYRRTPDNTYDRKPRNDRGRTEDGRPICFKCNRPGHVAKYCRIKYVRMVEEVPPSLDSPSDDKKPLNTRNLSPEGLNILGSISMDIKIDEKSLNHRFVVLESNMRSLIIGRDLLRRLNAKINCKRDILEYDIVTECQDSNEAPRKIINQQDEVVPQLCVKLVRVTVRANDGEYVVEPNEKLTLTNGLRIARCLITVRNKLADLWITNHYPRTLKIMKNQTLGYASPPTTVNYIEDDEEDKVTEIQIKEDLTLSQKNELRRVLSKYSDLFSSILGKTNLAKHRIDTENAKPIKHKPYRVSPKERDIIKEQIQDMLDSCLLYENAVCHDRLSSSASVTDARAQGSTLEPGLNQRPKDHLTSTVGVGAEAQRQYYTLPKASTVTSLSEAIDLLRQRYVVKSRLWVIRMKFNDRRQLQGETIADYISALRALAKDCAYGYMEDELIRDRFIVGTKIKQLRDRLLVETTYLNLDQVVQLATQYEKAQEVNKMFDNTPEGINKIAANDRRTEPNLRERKKISTNFKCLRCGGKHKATSPDCPAKDVKCHQCLKVGHFKKYCLSKFSVKNITMAQCNQPIHQPSKLEMDLNVNGGTISKKKDGSIRLCVDLREPNKAVILDAYPIPLIEDILSSLHGCKVFTNLDLSQAYHQIRLHPDSRYLTAFITHMGIYQFKRLPYGLSSAPGAFQRYLSELLMDIKGAEVLKILGHIIDDNRVHLDEELMKPLLDAPPPKDKSGLRSLIGMINWFQKYIPNKSTIMEPLQKLLKKSVPFNWRREHAKALQTVKDSLKKGQVLALFCPKLPTVITTDASHSGIGCVVSQLSEKGEGRIVACASRTHSDAERKYSIVEKEALACVWACEKFRRWVWGLKFTLRTDQSSLTTLLTTKGNDRAGLRIARWSARLMNFDYNIEYKKGRDNVLPDYLSRSSLSSYEDYDGEVELIASINQDMLAISEEEFLRECSLCPEIIALKEQLMKPWSNNESSQLNKYFRLRKDLSVQEDLILNEKGKILVPVSLRNKLLFFAHKAHQGMVRTKQRLRESYWWPGMDKDVEDLVTNCWVCENHDKTLKSIRVPITPVERPANPWTKLGLDIVGPFIDSEIGFRFAITLIDYTSKWPEVFCTNKTNSKVIINFLEDVFSREGFPREIVTDNGTPFISEEFEDFLRSNGIKHIRTANYHPACNGEVENFNKTLKSTVLTAHLQHTEVKRTIQLFLREYRSTPHTVTKQTPSAVLHGRTLRTLVHVFDKEVKTKPPEEACRQEVKSDSESKSCSPKLQVGDQVKVQAGDPVMKGRSKLRGPFTITKQLRPFTFVLSDGKVWNARRLRLYQKCVGTYTRPDIRHELGIYPALHLDDHASQEESTPPPDSSPIASRLRSKCYKKGGRCDVVTSPDVTNLPSTILNNFPKFHGLLNQTHLTKEEKIHLLTDGLPNDWKDLIVAAQPTDATKWFHIAASIEQNRASIQFKPKNKIHLATKNNDNKKNVCPFWCPICSKKGIKIKHWVTDCEDYDSNFKKDRPNQNTSVKQVCGAPELLNVSTLTNTPTQGAFKLINISVEVNGIPAQAFVDTGATVSIINWRLFKRTRLQLQPNSDIHISQADGVTRKCGSLQTKVRIDKLIKPVTLHVMKNFKYPLLIGLDVASLFNLLIDDRDKTIYTKFDGLQNPILVNHLEEIREHELKELLEHNRNVFSQHAIDLGKVAIQHKIITKSEQPISLRPYRRPLKEYEEIAEQVKELLEHKLIRISDSPWAFPVVMVPKKDGNKRMCIDYRRLNEITLDDRQPLPHIQDMFDRLHGSRFFSTLDVAWGYWQIEMDPQSIQKTAFVTNDGHYEFLVMPFGLKNAASTFQRIIQHILGEILWKGTCSFQDDILVYTKTWQEHIELLSKVFDKLIQYNMKLKLSKCIFGRTEVKYLGHIISHNQLKPDPGKVKSIQDFPRPDTVKKVRQFMGLANYYRKFVKDFSEISFPLVRLTRKYQPFIWNEEVEESFAKLKMALSTKPALAIYNPDYPSKVYTDASKYGIGAILTQIGPDNEEHVIAYYSKTLQPHQENYSAYEMECLAVIQATDHFHVYIENQPFEIITDHAALQWLFTMKKPKPKYFRWILSLSSKSCNIVHRSGKQQTHVDALSRLPVVNIATQELQEHQQNSDLSFLKNSHTHDGVVMIKQKGVFKAVVPNSLTKKILEEYHDSLSHPSITKTCKLITQCYWWKGITTDIKNYVRSCKSCQLVKVRHEPTLGEMITPTSNIQPLQMIGCDTIVLGTAAANTKHKFIQVFVDHATRYLWAYPTITNTAQAVTQCLDKIIKSVNSINTILTDNGKHFISKEFNKFLSLQGIKHTYTSPYHPQCNGICEKLNDTIMTKLRIAVLEKPRCKWSSLLPQVVKNYNSTPHDVTGFSPLFLMYGIGNVPEFADQTPITIEEARKKASLRTEQIR